MHHNLKMIFAIWMIGVFLGSPFGINDASARIVQPGLGIGGNYSQTSRTAPVTTGSGPSAVTEQKEFTSSGFGTAATGDLTFYQENWAGFRLSADWMRLNTSGDDRLLGSAWFASGLLIFNFDLTKSRNVRFDAGAGYARGWYSTQSARFGNGATLATVDSGLVLEAKAMFRVKASHYIFLAAKYFVMSELNPKLMPLSMTVGFDF